ncbi:hypothetical protein ACFWDN_13210 [Micromonospora chalcea]
MPENETVETTETTETETPTTATTEGGEGTSTEAEEKDDEKDDDGTAELPKWAREKLTKANAEAANYRTRLREVEKKLSEAKTPEDFETATKELREANVNLERQLLRERVARKAGLPDDLAERLQGATQEELEADAKKLQKYAAAPSTTGDLRGGLDPSDEEDVFDPVKAAREARANRY